MTTIRQVEYNVIQCLKVGMGTAEIANYLAYPTNTISAILSRLCTLGVLERDGSKCLIVHENVEVKEDEAVMALRRNNPTIETRVWTEEDRYYIKKHLEAGIKRRELARRFRMEQLAFNHWLLEMKIGVKDVENADELKEATHAGS